MTSEKTVCVQGKKWVSSHYRGSDSGQEEKLEVRIFETEPAWVKANYGLTINLGNYESARCDVGVTLPTYVEEIPDALNIAWAIAEEEIQKQISKINK